MEKHELDALEAITNPYPEPEGKNNYDSEDFMNHPPIHMDLSGMWDVIS